MIIFNFIFDTNVDLFSRAKRVPRPPVSTPRLPYPSKSPSPLEMNKDDEDILVARGYADSGKLD
jgi:hypothetical protein